jgi:hypothetical protein
MPENHEILAALDGLAAFKARDIDQVMSYFAPDSSHAARLGTITAPRVWPVSGYLVGERGGHSDLTVAAFIPPRSLII